MGFGLRCIVGTDRQRLHGSGAGVQRPATAGVLQAASYKAPDSAAAASWPTAGLLLLPVCLLACTPAAQEGDRAASTRVALVTAVQETSLHTKHLSGAEVSAVHASHSHHMHRQHQPEGRPAKRNPTGSGSCAGRQPAPLTSSTSRPACMQSTGAGPPPPGDRWCSILTAWSLPGLVCLIERRSAPAK